MFFFVANKNFIDMSLTLAAIGGAISLASGIYGAIKSAKEGNQARSLIAQQRKDNKSWRDSEMSKDYMSRTDTQAVLKKQKEMLDDYYNRADKSSAVTGATDESKAIAKSAANKSLENTMTNIASGASAYKDSVDQQYRAQDNALNQQQAQSKMQQSQQVAQAAGQAVSAGLSLAGSGIGAQTPTTGATDNLSGLAKPMGVDAFNKKVNNLTSIG